MGIEKEKKEKEEGEKLASFFGIMYKFFVLPVVPVVPANVFVPVALPAHVVPAAFVPAGTDFLGAPTAVPCITTT